MDQDTAVAETETVVEEPAKKPRTRRRAITPRAKRTATRPSATRRPSYTASIKTKEDAKEIENALTSIYQDDNGRIPNMGTIVVKKGGGFFRSLVSVLVVGAVLAGLAWAGFVYLPNNRGFADTKVTLTLTGPEKLTLGVTTTYTLNYENNQDVPLHNVTLNIHYPAGFRYLDSSIPPENGGKNEWKLGTLEPKSGGMLTLTGQNFRLGGVEESWRALLNYQPENFNSELQKISTLTTVIDQSPLSVSISGPDKSALGADGTFTFTLNNTGEWRPLSLELIPALPSGFTITSSSPALDKNKKWIINFAAASNTSSTPPTTFTLKGKFGGTDEGPQTTGAYLELPLDGKLVRIGESALTTELTKNAVGFNTAINGATSDLGSHPGDMLNMTVRLKNTSSQSLKNATIDFSLEAPSVKRQSALAWAEIEDKYDGDIVGEQITDALRRGKITWNSKKIPALALVKPGDEVSIDVRLPIKDTKAFDYSAVNDHKITAFAVANFTDEKGTLQTAGASPIVITLNSDLAFENRHSSSGLSGGAEQHSFEWVLTNNFHSLKNITLTATVFGDTSWKNESAPTIGTVNFDESSKTITWSIPTLPESVDVANLGFTINLNKRNPTQNTLVSKVHIKAEDAVTGKPLDFMGDETSL